MGVVVVELEAECGAADRGAEDRGDLPALLLPALLGALSSRPGLLLAGSTIYRWPEWPGT